MFFDARDCNTVTGITVYESDIYRNRKRFGQDSVYIADGFCRKWRLSCGSLPSLLVRRGGFAPGFAELIVEPLNLDWRKFAQHRTAQSRLDMGFHLRTVCFHGHGFFVRTVFIQPCVEPAAKGHFGRFEIRTFLDCRNCGVHLLANFSLSLARERFSDTLTSIGIKPY